MRPAPPATPFDDLLSGEALEVHHPTGSVQLLDPVRWRGGPDPTDIDVVRRCTGPTRTSGADRAGSYGQALRDRAARHCLTVRGRWAARPGRGDIVELARALRPVPVC